MPRSLATPATLALLALLAAGCGAASNEATPAALKLERDDLVATARALQRADGPVSREVAATKAAWPLIANGLPHDVRVVSGSPAARRAAASAAALPIPSLFGERQARTLTGPASQIAGLYRSFALLSARGWKLLFGGLDQIRSGSPAAARFARENAPLYVESIYDAHFTLALLGKKLLAGYAKLGGAAGFGATLSQGQLDALAQSYSEADELHPHVGVRLGS